MVHALLAQLDRVRGYELRGRAFESLTAHHFLTTESERVKQGFCKA